MKYTFSIIKHQVHFKHPILAQGDPRTNRFLLSCYFCYNSAILILLALSTRTRYEWYFQKLEMKYASMKYASMPSLQHGICPTQEMHINTQLLVFLLI